MSLLYPMKLSSEYHEKIWGGKELQRLYGTGVPDGPVGESWVFSAYPGSASRVENGAFRGKILTELPCAADIRLLVKIIDASKDLSVQVHPSDASAIAENGERGKAEMWYVLRSAPRGVVYLGLKEPVNRDRLMESCQEGKILSCLNRVPVHRGDVFYIAPGTIHALGAGTMVAEIQQSSDTTFRLYDYDRVDDKGNKRSLQWERGCAVADTSAILPEECRGTRQAVFHDFRLSELFTCRYFSSWRLELHGKAGFSTGDKYRHLLVIEGKGVLRYGGKEYPLHTPDSYYLPSGLGEYEMEGNLTVLITEQGE